MAAKAFWPVRHSCGHEEEHDLSAKKSFRRASYARWLAGRDCGGCRWARRDMLAPDERSHDKKKLRPDEMAEIGEWAYRDSMPRLLGPNAAVDWAHGVRRLLIEGISGSQPGSVPAAEPADAVEAPRWRLSQACWRLSQACWWARQGKAEAAEVAPAVGGAGVPAADRGGEAC